MASVTPVKVVPKHNDELLCVICGNNVQKLSYHKIIPKKGGDKLKLGERLSKYLDCDQFMFNNICAKCERKLVKIEEGEKLKFEFIRSYKDTCQKNLSFKRAALAATPGKVKTGKRSSARVSLEDRIGDHRDDKTNNTTVEVKVTYNTSCQSKVVSPSLNNAIRNLAWGEWDRGVKNLGQIEDLKTLLVQQTIGYLVGEVNSLCSNTPTVSLFKQSSVDDLMNMNKDNIIAELGQRTPILLQVLRSLVKSDARQNDTAVITLTSVIVKTKNNQMSAWAARNGVVLHYEGLSETGLNMLATQGVTVTPRKCQMLVSDMCINFDGEVLQWKTDTEDYNIRNQVLLNAKQIVKEFPSLDLEPSDIADNQHKDSEKKPLSDSHAIRDQDSESNEFKTIDSKQLADLLDSPPPNKQEQLHCELSRRIPNVENSVRESVLVKLYDHAQHRNIALSDSVSEVIAASNEAKPRSFQIIGDNLDFHTNVKNQRLDKQGQDYHFFQMYAVQDEVSGDHLPDDQPIRDINTVACHEFIPSLEDLFMLRDALIPLWCRVLVKRMPVFSFLERSIIWHIPHEYSEEMRRSSDWVPLGILPKSENTTSEVIEIMEYVQSNYVPQPGRDNCNVEKPEKIFFGGDQLTEERFRNARKAMADGDSAWDRMECLLPKNEDWHAIRTGYQVMLDILRKSESFQDPGTYSSNANVTANTKAMRDIKTSFNEIKDFLGIHVDAHIVSATLSFFQMKDILDESVIPDNIRSATPADQQQWLHNKVRQMLDIYVISGINNTFTPVSAKLRVLEMQKRHNCTVCNKEFVYSKACLNHERKVHGMEHVQVDSLPDNRVEQNDYLYNHGCLTITLGLLLRNADDAVLEGDGERICRIWKMLTLLWRNTGHSKYAYAGLQLQAELIAMLTPRKSHQLKWNRTIKNKDGHRVSRDLHLEFLNGKAKEVLQNSGFQNFDERFVQKVGESMWCRCEIMKHTCEDLGVQKSAGHRSRDKNDREFQVMLREVHDRAKVFSFSENREYSAFPKLSRNVLGTLNVQDLFNWIGKHKREFRDRE